LVYLEINKEGKKNKLKREKETTRETEKEIKRKREKTREIEGK
jgi:hypothetical protein